MGAGVGSEPIAELLGLGLAIDGEGAADLCVREELGVEQVKLVASASGSGPAGIFILHPRGVRKGDCDIDGGSYRGSGDHLEVLGVLVETEAVKPCAIGGSDVLVAPGVVHHRAVEIAAVSDHLAVDFLDADLVQKGFPLSEKFGAGDGDRVLGGDGRVTATNYIEVTVKNAVSDRAAVGDAGDVLEVGAEAMDGHSGGYQLHRGGGHHPLAAVPRGEGIAAFGRGEDSEDGRFQEVVTGGQLYVPLGFGLNLRLICGTHLLRGGHFGKLSDRWICGRWDRNGDEQNQSTNEYSESHNNCLFEFQAARGQVTKTGNGKSTKIVFYC